MNIQIKKPRLKKSTKIMITIFVFPILLLVLVCIWGYVTHPIFDKFDKDRFTTLDAQMLKLFNELKSTSNKSDNLKYSAVCSANHSGWLPTGDYNCITSISTYKNVSSIQEVNTMHDKYYLTINSSAALIQKTDLDPELPGDFGKKFVVSSAEKRYENKQTKIECRYILQLDQIDESIDIRLDNSQYGSDIVGYIGKLTISFRCDETARDHWYELVQSTSSLIP